MPKYLIQVSYTAEGAEGVREKGGSARRAAAEESLASVGGTLESFYFALGEHDAYLVVDLPDNESAAALSIAVNATGTIVSRATVLLTPEQIDAAAQRAIAFSPPGS